MGLFGIGKKKEWDLEKSNENKKRMHTLFHQVVEDADTYEILYAYTSDVKTSNYVIARKTTYLYGSLILGYRTSDMSIVLVDTSPELDGCGEPRIYKRSDLKKVKIVQGQFTLYNQGGIMAGYTQFCVANNYDEDYFAYVEQTEEAAKFDEFWPIYMKG
ncbi:MAG: hypothetical protein RR531_01780 [Longicatena sp.]